LIANAVIDLSDELIFFAGLLCDEPLQRGTLLFRRW
jgi:hypothetical protein